MASKYFCYLTKYTNDSELVNIVFIRSIFLSCFSNPYNYVNESKVSGRVFCVSDVVFSSIHVGYDIYLQKSNNKRSHCMNGNIKFNNLKFAHFNKGNSNFMNKIDDICYILHKFRPHIFSIAEANYDKNDPYNFTDYNTELCDFKVGHSLSRQILLISKEINYTRRTDLEDKYLALIICDIHINKTTNITIAAHYRQWNIPKQLQNMTSETQIDRYNRTINIFQKILDNSKNDFLIFGDDNIDTLNNNNIYNNYRLNDLKQLRDSFLINNNLVSHHNKPTFFRRGNVSCLDHLYSNCPSRVKNVTIEKEILSDHKIMTFNYNNKKLSINATYKILRDYSLLTKDNLIQYLNATKIDDLMASNDPNTIAKGIIEALNITIDSISPSKLVQCTKNHTKWYDKNLQELAKIKNEAHSKAKNSNDPEKWRIFRNIRNKYNNTVRSTKDKYYTDRLTIKSKDKSTVKIKPELNSTNKLWTTIKEVTNNVSKSPPRNIIHNGQMVTSLRKISNIANKFYIDKINKIRDSFTPNEVDHIEILESLIEKPKSKFILPKISISQTKKLIKGMKASNSVGLDLASIKIYKKLVNRISPIIAHLINCIIESGIYPDILKISKISPIIKPDKDANSIDSYRPINNLSTLDKIVEQYLKNEFQSYLDLNNIINCNHHGSRKFHGTNTAITQINDILNKNYEANKVTATVVTDLSAAFDTIDSTKLIDKLNFYGVKDKELSIFSSFLTNRKQFTEIDTFKSTTLDSPQCSVIQGSKLSAILYTLYTNEVTLLYKLMNQPIFTKMTGKPILKCTNVDHSIVNYVDDSTNLISSEDIISLKLYLDNYYILLENFYNINFLKLNPDKTKLLVTCKPNLREGAQSITLQANKFTISQTNSIKILGVFITSGFDHTPNVNAIVSKVNYRIYVLKKIARYTNVKTRQILYNSLIVSIFSYCANNLINMNKIQLNKLSVLYNKCAHNVLGLHSYKLNLTTIYKKLNWTSFPQLIILESLKLIHKISYEHKPKALYDLFYFNMERSNIDRLVRKPSLRYRSLSAKTANSYLHRSTYMYNNLPDKFRIMNRKIFNKQIKLYIMENCELKFIPKIPDDI